MKKLVTGDKRSHSRSRAPRTAARTTPVRRPFRALSMIPENRRMASLVARRAVHAGDRDVVQPEVDAEMRAVVDDVVQDVGPDHGRTRHREDRIAALQQRPGLPHLLVPGPLNCLAGRRDVLVEQREDLLPAGQLRWRIRLAAHRGEVARRRAPGRPRPDWDCPDWTTVPPD